MSSVSKRWNPVCFSRIRPTEDFPVPMNPISTMDLAELTGAILSRYAKAPSPKLQHPGKLQTPKLNRGPLFWSLISWSFFGAWMLEFGILTK